jgi:hypothetical protein
MKFYILILCLFAVLTPINALEIIRIQRVRLPCTYSNSKVPVNSVTVLHALSSGDQNDVIEHDQPSILESSTLLENSGDSSLESINSPEQYSFTLYNAAPLISGFLITAVSLFLTAYAFYAGLSGTDPLFQAYPT